MRKRLRLFMSGRVQGVFFRQAAKERAGALGLNGWARNAADGSLEIVIEGEEDSLKRFLAWAKEGPGLAEVYRLDVEWSDATREFEEFEVR